MSQALYRRYRPETFAEVIGQEHVTEPLMQALRNDRVNHAYLFSGPRGCGKTTSARILARSLNCEQGPTPEPCGVCDSCVALARGGPGSIAVIEIDAASHGGVDDARDLREKAFFAPASSRYKIYIVDEAHMVTTSGFNALLKIVEEPPPHLKFIFATTEPDKVIGTIRSRTHHYPFRLVPPGRLQDYLAQLCGREGVEVAKGVLPLVVRAGRGSVRDSLSVLDQLMAGAGADGVTYALATSLLGFTDAALLDDAVEAFAAGDGAAVFHVVDRVIEAGHDPKRFAEDLLERLRDLIVIAAVPDAAATILDDVPADQLERMRSQAALFGAASLSRAADILATGLTEMRSATAPRLQLELMCARVLLPAAHDDERSLQARLDRLERRLSMGGVPSGGGPGVAGGTAGMPAAGMAGGGAGGPAAARAAVRPAPAPVEAPTPDDVAAPVRRPDEAPRPVERPVAPSSAPSPAPAGQASTPPGQAAEPDDPWAVPAQWTSGPQGEPARPAATPAAAAPAPAAPTPAAAPTAAGAAPAEPAPAPGGLDVGAVRGLWTEVLSALAVLKRATWTLVSQNAKVADLAPGRLTLAFSSAGLRDAFARGVHPELVRQALIDVLGLDVQVEAIVDPSAAGGAGGAGGTAPRAGAPVAPPPAPAPSAAPRPAATRPAATRPEPPAHPPAAGPDPSPVGPSVEAAGRPRAVAEDDPSLPPEPPEEDDPWAAPSPRVWAEGSARAAARPDTCPAGARPTEPVRPQPVRNEPVRSEPAPEPARRWVPPEQDVVSDDDPDADDSGLSGAELLVRELGATVIEERDEL
ncbi:MAG: DNA polymerase III subunit gamma and tau [Motilibacteraceae bacterium]